MLSFLRDQAASSLRAKVLLLTVVAFAAVAVPAFFAFNFIVESTVIKLGTLFAEKQILYDRHRGLGALRREVALAETLARSPTVLAWAADETDPQKRRQGLEELEHYRLAFSDRSYFFVVGASGNYYFNDREGSHTGDQLRYRISPDNPRDGWYYKTAAAGPGCQLNVDNDDNLRVTKVWINCVVVDGGRIAGILGTGIDLTTFIRTVVDNAQTGVDSIFVDRSGAIQAYRDASRIDFHSLTKDTKNKKTVFLLLDHDADRAKLAEMMDRVRTGGDTVAADFLGVEGRKMLVGIGYLESLGWFNVTVMDVDAIIDKRLFLPIGLLLALIMVTAAGLVTWLFKRSVLDRIAAAERTVSRVARGDFSRRIDDAGQDEIARLARSVNRMAVAVRDNRDELEAAVRSRTAKLESIAYLDPLTGVLNRRGATEAFAQLQSRSAGGFGFLLLDIDRFKQTNDTYGHETGDRIVCDVAGRLLQAAGARAYCGRWGGDEFVILIEPGQDADLAACAARLLHAVAGSPVVLDGRSIRVTPSIGYCRVGADETVTSAAKRADVALYRAKHEGRNRAVRHDADLDRPAPSRGLVA